MKLGVWQKDMTDHRRLRARGRGADAAVRRDRPDLHCCHPGGRRRGHGRRLRGTRGDGGSSEKVESQKCQRRKVKWMQPEGDMRRNMIMAVVAGVALMYVDRSALR